ncbi:MAG: ATP-binding protein [Melioribacteraceae bacterium]|nr:ATP-binding protein [Melioribacteraceae bacterium]
MIKKDYKIASDYSEVPKLCETISSFCKENVTENSICNEIEICLVESLNNIIKHAYKEDNSRWIDLSIEINTDNIIINVKDDGIPREGNKKPSLDFDPDDIENLPEGGMGLFIIDQLMDELTYKSINGANIFTMKKSIE